MKGSIVLNNAAGRALRRRASDVFARDVRDYIGNFHAGDTVYITFRAVDGGQYIIATGVVDCDESELRRKMQEDEEPYTVVRERDVKPLW